MDTSINPNNSSSNNNFMGAGHRHDFKNGTSDVNPLEQEVLDEYARLAKNMERLSETLGLLTSPSNTSHTLAPSSPTTTTPTTTPPHSSAPLTTATPLTLEIADSLRHLERKVASVYTLMKASVYSIVLQQGEMDLDNDIPSGEGTGDTGREGEGW